MLRINPIGNAVAAAHYFSGSSADYYLGKESPAWWHGKTAKMLGLEGEVKDEDFRDLISNRKPDGSRLTQRDNPKRRVAYDLTFSVPKSVTLLRAIAGDLRVDDVLRRAVGTTMELMEQDARVRVRKGGQNTDRVTGNLVWMDRLHLTSRDIAGEPDPHSHLHAVVCNASWDHAENKWKALEIGRIKADGDFYQAIFRQELANELQGIGYQIERKDKDFEVVGIPVTANWEFSRRTRQVEQLNRALANERGYDSLTPKGKDRLGATSRRAKSEGMAWEELQERWMKRLHGDEYQQIINTYLGSLTAEYRPKLGNAQAISRALEQQPETFFPKKKLFTAAAYGSLGNSTREGLEQALEEEVRKGRVLQHRHDDHDYLATRSGIQKEITLLQRCKMGIGMLPGSDSYRIKDFDPIQQKAFDNVFTSRDRVRLFRGLPDKRRSAVIDELKNALPEAIFLDRPSLDRVLTATEGNPRGVIVLLDMPRRDTLRRNASDLLEDLAGSKAATLSRKPEMQSTFSRVSDRLRRMAERMRQRRVHERLFERSAERQPERER